MSLLLRMYPGDGWGLLVANVLVQVTVVILAAGLLARLGSRFNADRQTPAGQTRARPTRNDRHAMPVADFDDAGHGPIHSLEVTRAGQGAYRVQR